jgi:predicted nuclease of predicted toxin-antitoxin system
LTFFADECVAESVCKFLEEHGHDVLRAKQKIPEGTQDPIVAKISQDLGAILLSDDNDMQAIVARRPDGQKGVFAS